MSERPPRYNSAAWGNIKGLPYADYIRKTWYIDMEWVIADTHSMEILEEALKIMQNRVDQLSVMHTVNRNEHAIQLLKKRIAEKILLGEQDE